MMEGLRSYCEQTSLHGWYYISVHGGKAAWRIVWSFIVLTSVVVAAYFIYKAAEDFTKSTVVTTIDSTTEPLSDVFFPAVTVCNINQVRKSFFKDINIHNNEALVDILYQQFYSGSKDPPTPENLETIRRLFTSEPYVKSEYQYHRITHKGNVDQNQLHENWTSYLEEFQNDNFFCFIYRKNLAALIHTYLNQGFIEKGFQFTRLAVQEPYGVMVLKASYGRESRFGDSVNSSDFNPYFGTDYGICSLIKPQLAFNRSLDEIAYWSKVFGDHNWHVSRGAEVGKANGLSMLLDAETFDYTFHLKAGEGFKIAVHHHLDQPIMSIKELDISPGSVFQIAVTPTLMSTTPDAIDRFTPSDRGCYREGELPLKYLPSKFYRYEMSNCLFESAYENILKRCNCTPSFHQLAYVDYPNICRGPGLTCMNDILRFIGKLNQVGDNQQECLAACEDQINNVGVTSSDFPNRETFVKRDEFCITLRKLNRTCHSEKREFLVAKFPNVCDSIITVKQKVEAMNGTLCDRLKWRPVRSWKLSKNDKDVKNLEETIFLYAKKNLAVVNVYIKDPVVTRIIRSEKIPIINFVAYIGGLLGLCMGFSLVSVFEIVFHLGGAIKKEFVRRKATAGRQMSFKAKDSNHTVVPNHTPDNRYTEETNNMVEENTNNSNEVMNASSTIPKSSSIVNSRKNSFIICKSKGEDNADELKTINSFDYNERIPQYTEIFLPPRSSITKHTRSSNCLGSKNGPPNGSTKGIGNPLMVDVATASPPSKSCPEGCNTVKVVANFVEEEPQKYSVKPLPGNCFQDNSTCYSIEEYMTDRQSISKSLTELDGPIPIRESNSYIEESYGNPIQNTITSFVFSKDKNSSTKYSAPRKAYHKVHLDRNLSSNSLVRRHSQHHSDDLKRVTSYSDARTSIFPKSETLTDLEGTSRCSSKSVKSHSLSPMTGCERLL